MGADKRDEKSRPLLSEDRDEPAPPMDAAAKKAALKQKMLLISFILMIFIGLGNKVFNKLMTAPMHK